MTFSQAIEKAKSGSKIARAAWADQYVALTKSICYRSVKDEVIEVSNGTKFIFVAARRIVDNWVATADDMLAEDWEVKS